MNYQSMLHDIPKGEVLFHFIIVQLLSEENEGLMTIHLLE